MPAFVKEILRWSVILLSGGYGLWTLGEGGYAAVARGTDLFFLSFTLLVATPPLAVAWIVFRRQYRKLFLVVGAVGGFALFCELMALPDQLGVFDMLDKMGHERSALSAILGLPIALLWLFGPVYATAWFFRLCCRFAYEPEERCRTKTRPTGWLISLGVACLLLPMAGLLLIYSGVFGTSPSRWTEDAIERSVAWCVALTSLGAIFVVLGMVRRQMAGADCKGLPARARGEATR